MPSVIYLVERIQLAKETEKRKKEKKRNSISPRRSKFIRDRTRALEMAIEETGRHANAA